MSAPLRTRHAQPGLLFAALRECAAVAWGVGHGDGGAIEQLDLSHLPAPRLGRHGFEARTDLVAECNWNLNRQAGTGIAIRSRVERATRSGFQVSFRNKILPLRVVSPPSYRALRGMPGLKLAA